MLAQEFCRSRRAPGREPGANENAALFSIQWPMRYQGFLAIPARSLGQDLPLFRLRRGQKREVCAVKAGRTGPMLRVQSTQYERRGGCGADEIRGEWHGNARWGRGPCACQCRAPRCRGKGAAVDDVNKMDDGPSHARRGRRRAGSRWCAPLGYRSSLSRVGDDGELLAVGKLHVVAGHGWPAASSARDAHRSCSISSVAFSASW